MQPPTALRSTAYAGTNVPVSRSQEQIRTLLQKSNASGIQFTEDWIRGVIGFRFVKIEKRTDQDGKKVELPLVVRMTIPLWNDPRRYLQAGQDARTRRERQVMRALYWYLKSQLEAVAFGLRDFEDVFMADLEMRDGLTIGDHVRSLVDSGKLALPVTAGIE